MNARLNHRLDQAEALLQKHVLALGAIIVVAGFLLRFWHASDFYLNPDEALHYLVATQPSLAAHDFHGWTRIAHPPLFTLILRGAAGLNRSEWMLRLAPMAAGALFPWFVMVWIRRFASDAAALGGQLFLTFSPLLIDLSAEVRAYTVTFLFLSVSLVLLETALDRVSKIRMVWFHVFVYLAILTEYCAGWMIAAMGCYALLRLRDRPARNGVGRLWAAGQAGALAIYVFLYFAQVSKWSQTGLLGDPVNTWLQWAFLQPGQSVGAFAAMGSLKQFKYLFGMRLLAPAGAAAFGFGWYRLWKSGHQSHALLIGLPFCLACLGGIFHFFPYGETRHTAVLGIVAAAGIGSAAAFIFRHRIFPLIIAAALAIPFWNAFADDSAYPIPRARRSRTLLLESVQFMRDRVPAGSAIVTDRGTDMMLAYYLQSPDDSLYPQPYGAHNAAGLKIIVAPPFAFSGDAELREALSEARQKYSAPLWVAAGGFRITVTNPSEQGRKLPFQKTLSVFEAPLPAASGEPIPTNAAPRPEAAL